MRSRESPKSLGANVDRCQLHGIKKSRSHVGGGTNIRGAPESARLTLQGALNVYTEYHGNPSGICGGVSVCLSSFKGTCRVGDVLFFKDENKMRRTNHRRVCLKPKTSTLLVSDPPLTPWHKASPLAPLDWNHNTRAFRCMKEHKMKTEALAPLSLDLSLPLSGPPSHRFSLPPSLIVLVITPPVYDCDLIWANPDHWNYKSDIYF